MAITTSRAPVGASPLWIIALFIALSEVTAGVASITTDGAARLLFAIFAVSFPIGVFVTFVWLLIRHAPNLYPPGEYSETITPEIYAAGVHRQGRAELEVFGKAVAEIALTVSGDDAGQPASREALASQFESVVVSSSVEVEIGAIAPGAPALLFPVGQGATVRDLLDTTYFALRPHVRPYEYLKTWALRRENGEVLDNIGTQWARRAGQTDDWRRLEDVKILPGERLSAYFLTR